MTKKRTLQTVAGNILRLERQLVHKEKDRQDVLKKIRSLYKVSIQGEQSVKPGREGVFESMGTEDHVCEEGPVLEAKDSRLSHEISALTDLIEEAKKEVFNLAQSEVEEIPEQIAVLQGSLLKKRESILSELMGALEHVSSLHWRLNGARVRIPWEGIGNLVLPSLPREAVIESNKRLDILFKGQPKEGDSYAVELELRELREKRAGGKEGIARAVMANAR